MLTFFSLYLIAGILGFACYKLYRYLFPKKQPWYCYIWEDGKRIREANGNEYDYQRLKDEALKPNYTQDINAWRSEPWEKYVWDGNSVMRKATAEEESWQKRWQEPVDPLLEPGMEPVSRGYYNRNL